MRPGFALRSRCAAGSLLAAVALLTAGCANLSLPWLSRSADSGDAVQVDEIRRLGHCATDGDEVAVVLLADEAELQRWQEARGIDLITAAPGGLLPPGPFAVIDHGSRPTGGYGLAVSRRAQQEGRSLRLTASFLSPGADLMQAQVLSSPCVLVKLPPGNYDRVSVVDPAGKLRAQSPPPPIIVPVTAP